MDLTQEQLAQEQLDEIRNALKKINDPTPVTETEDTVTIAGYEYSSSYNPFDLTYNNGATTDTITLNPGAASGSLYSNTVIGGGYTISPSLTGANTGPYTISAGAGTGYNFGATNATNTSLYTNATGQLNLEGDNADIKINGRSLTDVIQKLEERLNVLVPNPELEKEWDELKELGDKYRALEAKLKEQGEMWAKLKAMPPPEPLY